MSVRLGTPVLLLTGAAAAVKAVTVPTGNALTLTTPGIGLLTSVYFKWVATATAGSRLLSLLVKDSSNNLIFQSVVATALVASTTLNAFYGPGIPSSNAAGPPITTYAAIPFEFPLPNAAIIQAYDSAAIDVLDTALINATYVY